ncbi:hypothetical protein EV360DRAFT_89114 [Lentinula raphanica]|nr:hypothetical protein EV360DRAFT_89114 [Lentinula raphanica]
MSNPSSADAMSDNAWSSDSSSANAWSTNAWSVQGDTSFEETNRSAPMPYPYSTLENLSVQEDPSEPQGNPSELQEGALPTSSHEVVPDEMLSQPAESSNAHGPSSAPVRAWNIDHACELLQISKPHGTTYSTEWLSVVVQDWHRIRSLIFGMGYKERKGDKDLSEQFYQWEDGMIDSFETILKRVNWTKEEYMAKTNLFLWANKIAAEKMWDPNVIEPADPVQRQNYQEAVDTWQLIVDFFQNTSFQYSGYPELLPEDSPDARLASLTRSRMKHHRRMIMDCLVDRP